MKKILLCSLLFVTPAIAQQQPSPAEQALIAKLLKEIQEGLTCSAGTVTLQLDLAKAQARIKELEASQK